MFNNKQYDQYGRPIRSPKKRLFLILAVLFSLLIIFLIVRGGGSNKGTSKPAASGTIELLPLGVDAYIKYPASFTITTEPGTVFSAGSPDGVEPKEAIEISYYQDRSSGVTAESFANLVTTNVNGKLNEVKSEVIPAAGEGGREIVAVWQTNEDKTITANYYYLYPDKIWDMKLVYQPGSFLDKSQREIAESFVAGGL